MDGSVKATMRSQVTDEQLAVAAVRFPYNPPTTKEATMSHYFFINTILK
jgi:hypothetical protein